MTPFGAQDLLHPQPTRRSQYRYVFTAKHHGGGPPDAARWFLNPLEEFSVFDDADFFEIADDAGRLYGILRDGADGLRYLGTWNQQLAEFPLANEGQPWHGYPLWPLKDFGPENRRGEKHRPAKQVFVVMERAGLITRRERKRLLKGSHV